MTHYACTIANGKNARGYTNYCGRLAVLTIHVNNELLGHYCKEHAIKGAHRICMRAIDRGRYAFQEYETKGDDPPYHLVKILDLTPEVDE